MLRKIIDHQLNDLNNALLIEHSAEQDVYFVSGPQGSKYGGDVVRFHTGPIKEDGVNGLSIEALLAICIDRLHGFQTGPYACWENQTALNNLRSALDILHWRTRNRMERGVEGTSEK